LWPVFNIKTIILPRQTRDKQREYSKKGPFCSKCEKLQDEIDHHRNFGLASIER
jgi:hypothetical protein